MSDEERPLTPDARARPGARGVPVVIDGAEWLLADYVPSRHAIWDELFDFGVTHNWYPHVLLVRAANQLLYPNYDLTPDECATLATAVDPEAVVPAVERAFSGGVGAEDFRRTWSDWVECSLWANGIDPDRVPPWRVPLLMEYLEEQGKVIPAAEYIDSLFSAAQGNTIRRMAMANQASRPPAAPPADPAPDEPEAAP